MGDVAGKLLKFLLIPVYTAYLLPSEYGILNLCLLYSGFAAVFCFWGVNSAFFRYFVPQEREKGNSDSFSNVFLLVTIFSLLVFFLSYLFSRSLSWFLLGSASEAYLIRITAISVLVNSPLATLLLLYRAEGKPISYVKVTVAKLFVALLCNLYLVVGLKMGVRGVLYSDIISSALLLLFLLIKLFPYLSLHISLNLSRKLLSYGIPLVPAVLSGVVIMLSDRYFIELYQGAKAVGIYSLGYRVGIVVNLAVMAFNFSWSPAIFRIVKEEGAKRIFSDVLNHYVALVGLILLGLYLFQKEIFSLFVNASYHQGLEVVVLIAISYFIYGLYLNFEVGLYLKDKTPYVTLISLLAASLNIGLNLLLIPRMGIKGAAWATLLSYLFMAGLGLYLSQSQYRVRYDLRRLATNILLLGGICYLSSFFTLLIYRALLFLPYLFWVLKAEWPLFQGEISFGNK